MLLNQQSKMISELLTLLSYTNWCLFYIYNDETMTNIHGGPKKQGNFVRLLTCL